MRAPHPDLNDLYRQAATPTALLERERRQAELVGLFEFDLDAAGISGEAVLAPLTDPVLLDAPLEQALVRLDEAALPGEEFYARPRRPRLSNNGEAGGREAHSSGDGPQGAAARRFARVDPPGIVAAAQPPLSKALPGTSEARGPTAAPPVAAPAGASGLVARKHAAATAGRADQWLRGIAERSGAVEALHRTIEVGTSAAIDKWFAANPDVPLRGAIPPVDASTSQPSSAGATDVPERLTQVLARIDSRTSVAAQTPAGDVHERADRTAAPGFVGPASRAGPVDSGGGEQPGSVAAGSRRTAPPPSPTHTSSRILSAPTGGLRGLAALGRTMAGSSGANRADARERKPLPPGGLGIASIAIDADQLADLLRREAERSGIDLAGLEP
jgi:hypothetical protein